MSRINIRMELNSSIGEITVTVQNYRPKRKIFGDSESLLIRKLGVRWIPEMGIR